MPLAATFQPAASSAARALAGSTRPGSDGFHAAVVSPCFPGFFTDSTSSQNSLCFAPLSSITTPCFPADTTLPERPPQDPRAVSQLLAHVDYLDEAIQTVGGHIDEVMVPFTEDLARLDTIR